MPAPERFAQKVQRACLADWGLVAHEELRPGATQPQRNPHAHCPSGRRSARVELSAKVLDTPAKLRRTLLHELCHVATWLLPPHEACPAIPCA